MVIRTRMIMTMQLLLVMLDDDDEDADDGDDDENIKIPRDDAHANHQHDNPLYGDKDRGLHISAPTRVQSVFSKQPIRRRRSDTGAVAHRAPRLTNYPTIASWYT